jgi:hypothetical protein
MEGNISSSESTTPSASHPGILWKPSGGALGSPNLIVDNECSPGQRKIIYIDSISTGRQDNFNTVIRLLRQWEGDTNNFVQMDSPSQALGSNDCAVYTLAACAHYVFRTGNFLPTSFQFQNGTNATQYGREWRRHVHKSIMNQRIDMSDPVLGWMVLQP